MELKVKTFKEILERALNEVESYEENDLVKTSCNTHGMSSFFVSLGSNGYVDLHNIDVKYTDDEQGE